MCKFDGFYILNYTWLTLANYLKIDKGSPPFWNLTKILRKRSRNIPILKHNGYKYVTNQEKSDILAQTLALKHSISANLGDPVTNATVHNTLESFRSTNEFYIDRTLIDFLEVSTIVNV